ncbi:hypothetical protein ES703_62846 [subsurface metagenome]
MAVEKDSSTRCFIDVEDMPDFKLIFNNYLPEILHRVITMRIKFHKYSAVLKQVPVIMPEEGQYAGFHDNDIPALVNVFLKVSRCIPGPSAGPGNHPLRQGGPASSHYLTQLHLNTEALQHLDGRHTSLRMDVVGINIREQEGGSPWCPPSDKLDLWSPLLTPLAILPG